MMLHSLLYAVACAFAFANEDIGTCAADGTCSDTLERADVAEPVVEHPPPDNGAIESLEFSNHAEERMELWWQQVNALNGVERSTTKVMDLPPGKSGIINTYAGHVFLWVHPSGDANRGKIADVVNVFRGMPAPSYKGPRNSFEASFFNMASETMEVWWQGHSPDGAGSFVAEVPAQSELTINTYHGHVFLWVRPRSKRQEGAPAERGEVLQKVSVYDGMLPSRYPASGNDDSDATRTWPQSIIDHNCTNRRDDEFCSREAARGGCMLGPGWMSVHCAASCGWCHLRVPSMRCHLSHLNVSNKDAWEPGNLDAMFASLRERLQKSQPHVNVTILSSDPYIVSLDNFISDYEVKTLLGTVETKFQRSTDQGAFDKDGVQAQITSTHRTSENAWCTDGCFDNEVVQAVVTRIEEAVQVPRANFESFQVLRYEKNQFYTAHHDESGGDSKKLAAGPRIMTFFMYLSDVEEGGETAFPKLPEPLVVRPKKGSAILWPSVLNKDPRSSDPRMIHEARPVVQGVKFAANAWIHLRDYRRPNFWGCTGSFS